MCQLTPEYISKRKLQCNKLIIHSGGIPKELVDENFKYMNNETEVFIVYGTKDEYLNEYRIIEETQLAKELFGNKLKIIPFEGKHVVNVDFIKSII